MDHDDDTRDGLDDLSRLFDTGPVTLPSTASDAPAPTASDQGPGAPGSVSPGAPRSVITTSVTATPAPSFGMPFPGMPAGADAAAASPPPFSPPPLVPATPLQAAPTPPPAAPPASDPAAGGFAPVPAAADAFAPLPTRDPAPPAAPPDAPVAPAFGGVAIAPRGEASPPPVATWSTPVAEPTLPTPASPAPPVEESAAAPAPTVASPSPPVAAAPATTAPPPESSAPPVASAPAPSSAPFSPGAAILPGGSLDDIVDDDAVARSTLAERIFFVLAIVLPPIGLIGTVVAAIGSFRRRGWVIGLLRAGMAIGVVLSIVCAGGAYVGYKAFRQQQAHAQTAAASTAFCAAFAKDKTLATADGGWPQPAASIPDSLTAMQSFVDRWNAVAKVSPSGIQPGVTAIASAGSEIIKSVQVQRTVDDAQNRSLLQSAVSSSGVAGWRADYCE